MDLKSFSEVLGKDKDTRNLIIIAIIVLGISAIRKMPALNLGAFTGFNTKPEEKHSDKKEHEHHDKYGRDRQRRPEYY